MIGSTRRHDQVLADLASRRPTLVVSPMPLGAFKPRRGRIYQGRAIGKDEQLARLAAMGIPIPRTTQLVPGLSLDPAVWGSHVIIKPTSSRSSRGVGFPILPTEKLRFRRPEHTEGSAPLMIQQYIETGPSARHYRVNTLFGRALYCLLNILNEPLPDLQSITNEVHSNAIATNPHDANKRAFELVNDKDVIELAARCHAAFPEVPLKGVDIIRDHKTGQLYVLELNCTSYTWHISSDYFAELRTGPITKEKMIAQFGAWDIAAAALIERTRWDAI
jgi:glutathione synthase/RimK-type ligase-like ATP-grasp enzyme